MKPDITAITPREKVEKTPRKPLSLSVKYAILLRYGQCRWCKRNLSETGVEFDHAIPIALGGKDDPTNMMPLCPKCHRLKTDSDIGRIAKAKRQGGETGQVARRERNGPQIQSRNTLGGEEYRRRRKWKQDNAT